MSFFTDPISSRPPVGAAGATPGPARSGGPAPVSDPVTVDTMPASPPPEVLDAIGVAARAAETLAQSGRRLQFSVDPPTGRVSVQVTDHSGNVLGSLSGAQALDVADGQPLR
jgi:hypothetical protein